MQIADIIFLSSKTCRMLYKVFIFKQPYQYRSFIQKYFESFRSGGRGAFHHGNNIIVVSKEIMTVTNYKKIK